MYSGFHRKAFLPFTLQFKLPEFNQNKNNQNSNFLCYYWAANVRSILHWCCLNDQPPLWLQIEEASCGSSSLMSLLCLPLTLPSAPYSNNVIV